MSAPRYSQLIKLNFHNGTLYSKSILDLLAFVRIILSVSYLTIIFAKEIMLFPNCKDSGEITGLNFVSML